MSTSRWLKITQADLIDHKVAALVEQLQAAALGEDQDDPTPGMIRRVIDRVRLKVASCKDNRVDADPETIPAGLKDQVLDLIIYALKNRLELDLTKAEIDNRKIIEADLNAIAACRLSIDIPDTPVPAPVESGGGAELISSSPRLASRRQTAGL